MSALQTAKQWLALARFRNPWLLVMDRLGWLHTPYSVVSCSGIKIEVFPQTSDRYTVFEVFGLGVYDIGLSKLSTGDVVVDIGANIGAFSAEAARIVGPSGKIIAVEPEEGAHGRLVENIRRNGLTTITPIRGALAGRSGILELHVPGRASLFTSMYQEVDGLPVTGTVQCVKCVTLKELFDVNRIGSVALLKLDCEGAEHDIIDTLSPDLTGRIKNLIIEFHRIAGKDVQASIDKLKSLGYTHAVDHNHLFSR